jgi:hypothetical protein
MEKNDLSAQYPQRVKDMMLAAQNWPSATDSGPSIFSFLMDIDTFGGEENRGPWAEAAIENANAN